MSVLIIDDEPDKKVGEDFLRRLDQLKIKYQIAETLKDAKTKYDNARDFHTVIVDFAFPTNKREKEAGIIQAYNGVEFLKKYKFLLATRMTYVIINTSADKEDRDRKLAEIGYGKYCQNLKILDIPLSTITPGLLNEIIAGINKQEHEMNGAASNPVALANKAKTYGEKAARYNPKNDPYGRFNYGD